MNAQWLNLWEQDEVLFRLFKFDPAKFDTLAFNAFAEELPNGTTTMIRDFIIFDISTVFPNLSAKDRTLLLGLLPVTEHQMQVNLYRDF